MGAAQISILLRLRPRQQLGPGAGPHRHQPVTPVALVGDDRDFLASVINRPRQARSPHLPFWQEFMV
jgi:hypothetical protein